MSDEPDEPDDPPAYRPARTPYAPAQPDCGHVMDAIAALHKDVRALAAVMNKLLRSLADEPDEGEPGERDQTQSLG